jgi:hypothetical protein
MLGTEPLRPAVVNSHHRQMIWLSACLAEIAKSEAHAGNAALA